MSAELIELVTTKLKELAETIAPNKVVVSRIAGSVSDPMAQEKYYFTCKVCKKWVAFPDQGPEHVGKALTWFCEGHKHLIEPLPAPPPHILDNKNVESSADPFNLMADIKTTFSKSRTIVAISSDGLKFIAKASDFNVDVQCMNNTYRALCNRCQATTPLSRQEVLMLDKASASLELADFLKEHKHDNINRPQPEGRKFRNGPQL
jgi:hypothetical protein